MSDRCKERIEPFYQTLREEDGKTFRMSYLNRLKSSSRESTKEKDEGHS